MDNTATKKKKKKKSTNCLSCGGWVGHWMSSCPTCGESHGHDCDGASGASPDSGSGASDSGAVGGATQ